MEYKDYVAPRDDGSLARYRAYNALGGPLIIDCERAYAAKHILGEYNKSYSASTTFFVHLSSVILIGGFISLIWWPWWVPIIGLFISWIMFKSAKQSCADFAKEIALSAPENKQKLIELGIIREMPDKAE